jgi:predicted MFS family arabinose efflux permease
MMAGFPILAMVQSSAGYFIAAAMLGFGGGVIMPSFHAMVNNMVEPRHRGAANSTLFSALDLGIGGGMVVTGLLADAIGISNAFLACAGLCLVAMVYYFSYVHPHYLRHKLAISQS